MSNAQTISTNPAGFTWLMRAMRGRAGVRRHTHAPKRSHILEVPD